MRKNVLMFAAGFAVAGIIAGRVIWIDESRMKKLLGHARITHKIMKDFMVHLPSETVDEIMAKYEFDMITFDL